MAAPLPGASQIARLAQQRRALYGLIDSGGGAPPSPGSLGLFGNAELGDVVIAAPVVGFGGLRMYRNLTINAGIVASIGPGFGQVLIKATEKITILGSIDGTGAAGNLPLPIGSFSGAGGGGGGGGGSDDGGAGGDPGLFANNGAETNGNPGQYDQGSNLPGIGGSGGVGGIVPANGTPGTTGTIGTINAEFFSSLHQWPIGFQGVLRGGFGGAPGTDGANGGAGGGGGGFGGPGGAGGAGGLGGGCIILTAPVIELGLGSQLLTAGIAAGSGVAGSVGGVGVVAEGGGGGGGGGAGGQGGCGGPILILYGLTFTDLGVTIFTAGGSLGLGANGANGGAATGSGVSGAKGAKGADGLPGTTGPYVTSKIFPP